MCTHRLAKDPQTFAHMALPGLRSLPKKWTSQGTLAGCGNAADAINGLAHVQGFVQMGLSLPDLRTLLAAVAEEAAQHSLVVGELPPMPHDQVLSKGHRCLEKL